MMQLYQELKYGTIKPQINFAPAFPTPALRKKREERGTHCVGDAREIKSLGPALSQNCCIPDVFYLSG
jgi:hypothetical protein